MKALVAVALLGLALPLAAQQVTVASPAAARLRVTTTSEEASRQFFAGVSDARNLFFTRAVTHFDKALEVDTNLGLARAFRAAVAPGFTQAERVATIDSAIAKMSSATTAERVVALALREFPDKNRAHALWESAVTLLPGDPNVAFYAALTAPAPGAVAAIRAVTERFPDDAAAFNILAYQLWQAGDHDAALTAVRRYVELAPDQPNAQDSYAELLQWSGRSSEAQAHYARSVQLDASFSEAYMGSAELAQLSGRGSEARRQIQLAITHSPSREATVTYTRNVARSFLMDGMVKEGMEQFAAALKGAQALNRPKLIAQIHQDMAIADAQLGRSTDIASHVAAAAQAGGAEDPMQIEITAAANALAGDTNVARQAIQKLTALAQPDNQYATRTSVMRALIALRANKPAEALTQLQGAPLDDPWVRTLTAECYLATGNVADARALKNQVLNDPQLNFDDAYNIAARIRAAKIKA
ncbi:MAG TPA: tetratricopeptide repeat protein [Gemmatimonadales bacterium]|nr:tetratricopeptide repeat protein [Gemmatimonadales bacterium]